MPSAVVGPWSERSGAALQSAEVEPQQLLEFRWEERDEVGVSTEPCVVIRKDSLRRGGSTEFCLAFQYQHLLTGCGKAAGCCESIVSAADNDRVIARRNRGHSGSALQVVCRSLKLRTRIIQPRSLRQKPEKT